MSEIVELNEKALWPLADDEDHGNGWILSCHFLRAIKAACEQRGEYMSMEAVEAVLLAAQVTALMTPNAQVTGRPPADLESESDEDWRRR